MPEKTPQDALGGSHFWQIVKENINHQGKLHSTQTVAPACYYKSMEVKMKKAKELKDILICRILKTDFVVWNDELLHEAIFNFRTSRAVICLAENCVTAERLSITAEDLLKEIS